jgi:predicted RecB family nuclease
MRDHPVVAWLLGEALPLFDMSKVVKRCLALPTPGVGLKAVCKHPKLVNFQWQNEVSGSQWSVVQYVRFLRSKDSLERQRIRADIIGYNHDDVRAARALEVRLRAWSAGGGMPALKAS